MSGTSFAALQVTLPVPAQISARLNSSLDLLKLFQMFPELRKSIAAGTIYVSLLVSLHVEGGKNNYLIHPNTKHKVLWTVPDCSPRRWGPIQKDPGILASPKRGCLNDEILQAETAWIQCLGLPS